VSNDASPTLVWFRRDLRLADNAALLAAAERGAPIVPVYVFAPGEESPWAPGAASRVWLHDSLLRLDEALRAKGSRLVLRAGPTREALLRLVDETGATAIYWNRLYEPAFTSRDAALKTELAARGLDARSFAGALLCEPWKVTTKTGGPYRVFTPYWRTCLGAYEVEEPKPAPRALASPRNTARLSPHLHFGEVSPRQTPSRRSASLATKKDATSPPTIRAVFTCGAMGAVRMP